MTAYLKTQENQMSNNYLIGQRVLLNDREIGVIVKPEHDYSNGIWVMSPSRDYASRYAEHNVKPLPGGQL